MSSNRSNHGIDPHQGQPVYLAGKALDQSRAAAVLLHGRGASAEDILSLAAELDRPEVSYLAPQAAQGTWYPHRFIEPTGLNQPWLASALGMVARVLSHIEKANIPAERTLLLGFSQGACLAVEFAARNPRRYGGVAGLSGGLIGSEDELGDYPGALEETPVFLGCDEQDFHIPADRVRRTAEILAGLGAKVEMKLFPNLGHGVNAAELDAVRAMLDRILAP